MQRKQQTITVGIWGVHSGAGVTTLTIALANYLQGFLNKRTAVYEYNSSSDFVKIYECSYKASGMEGEGYFSLKNIDYYTKKSVPLINLSNGDYDMVLVDCGSSANALNEFMRCDYKIVMSSLQLWYCDRYEKFCECLLEYSGSDVWLHILGGDEAKIKHVKKDYGVTALKRPCIENAYIIDRAMIDFFQTLFA